MNKQEIESISSTFNFEFELVNDYLKEALGYSRTSFFSICGSDSIQIPENTTIIAIQIK